MEAKGHDPNEPQQAKNKQGAQVDMQAANQQQAAAALGGEAMNVSSDNEHIQIEVAVNSQAIQD